MLLGEESRLGEDSEFSHSQVRFLCKKWPPGIRGEFCVSLPPSLLALPTEPAGSWKGWQAINVRAAEGPTSLTPHSPYGSPLP